MGVVVVRYQCKPERADENQALIEKVFAELDASGPAGLRYASLRLADGVSFVRRRSVSSCEKSLSAARKDRRHQTRHSSARMGSPHD